MRLVDLQEESHDLYQLLCVHSKDYIDCACVWRGFYETSLNVDSEDLEAIKNLTNRLISLKAEIHGE